MKDYEMTQEQLDELIASCKATPVMMIGGVSIGKSAQENANDAWARLGNEMGFDHMTVRPNGRGERFFTARPIGETSE